MHITIPPNSAKIRRRLPEPANSVFEGALERNGGPDTEYGGVRGMDAGTWFYVVLKIRLQLPPGSKLETVGDFNNCLAIQALAASGFIDLTGVLAGFAVTDSDAQDVIIPPRERCEQVKASVRIEGNQVALRRRAANAGPKAQRWSFLPGIIDLPPNQLVSDCKHPVITMFNCPGRVTDVGSR